MKSKEGGAGGELNGCGVGVALESFVDAVGIAAERAAEIAEKKTGWER